MPLIEKYQNFIACKSHEFINIFDKKYNGSKIESKILEEANNQIVNLVKKETNKLLKEILHIASLNMKNSFSRLDA